MEAPSILAISLTLDCDDQQKYDDDPASDYEIFCFHWATVPFCGQSRHGFLRRICPLVTQSVQSWPMVQL